LSFMSGMVCPGFGEENLTVSVLSSSDHVPLKVSEVVLSVHVSSILIMRFHFWSAGIPGATIRGVPTHSPTIPDTVRILPQETKASANDKAKMSVLPHRKDFIASLYHLARPWGLKLELCHAILFGTRPIRRLRVGSQRFFEEPNRFTCFELKKLGAIG